MNKGFNKLEEDILSSKKLAEFKDRNLPIISISILVMLFLVLPACAKADFNSSTNLGTDTSINQSASAYLSGFNEGFQLGGMFVIALEGNSTIAEEYNVLVQQHNDLLNKTLGAEKAESNLLSKVPIPSTAPKKSYDPWEI